MEPGKLEGKVARYKEHGYAVEVGGGVFITLSFVPFLN